MRDARSTVHLGVVGRWAAPGADARGGGRGGGGTRTMPRRASAFRVSHSHLRHLSQLGDSMRGLTRGTHPTNVHGRGVPLRRGDTLADIPGGSAAPVGPHDVTDVHMTWEDA